MDGDVAYLPGVWDGASERPSCPCVQEELKGQTAQGREGARDTAHTRAEGRQDGARGGTQGEREERGGTERHCPQQEDSASQGPRDWQFSVPAPPVPRWAPVREIALPS